MLLRTLFIGNPCRLHLADGQFIATYNHVKGQELMREKKAPIEDLGCVVLEHPQINITHGLLNALIKHNVALIACDDKMMPSGMLLNLDGHTLQSERFRAQIEAAEPLKKQLWQQTIGAKIRNQGQVLNRWDQAGGFLLERTRHVKSGDVGNEEGRCSYYYWQHLFPPAWNFYRKREGLPPNNLLNYGYAIIRGITARALTGSGLLPTFGIFHRNRYNSYCLADDVMEPYRPFVDHAVREIIYSNSHVEEVSREHKVHLLQVLQTDVKIDGQLSPLSVAVQKTAASLALCFTGEKRKILYPELPAWNRKGSMPTASCG